MLSFFKTGIIIYILITSIGNVQCYCEKTLDEWNCAYNVNCNDINSPVIENIDRFEYFQFNGLNGMNRYRNIPVYGDENYDDGMIMTEKNVCNIIEYNTGYRGSRFYPVHMKYSRTEFSSVDKITHEINVLITHLDLSNNHYEFTPPIGGMDNLAQLNLSKNSLTVAKLSNALDLPKLTEIDLSHNTIKDIQYKSNQIYRRLKKINLSYNYLTKIPEAVFDPFNELETLDVSHNYIEILSPITFEGMKQLQHLNISFNRISDINSSLFRFIELKLLDLSNNNIQAIKADDFSKLANLELLDFNSNIVSTINKDSFNNMPLLRSLFLNSNKLKDVDKEMLSHLTALKNIDLSTNIFKNIPKNLFKGKHINVFSIKDNQLEGSLEKGMFEGLATDKLDLSNQHLNSVEDYAFNGLFNLAELLLNNNNISVLTSMSFKTVRNLKSLDLSFNKIQNIEFEKDDLLNLLSLSLRNNYLTVVKQENFNGLFSLQFLDLSDNKIAKVESDSFFSLRELINFQISNNPLNGTLEASTFDGLSSLPSLDISCTLISSIQNGSFVGMLQLKNLNVSQSKINTLEYNIFVHTGAIETIDLSFNELKDFNINSTELASLNTLYLNNNLIKMLDPSAFESILSLVKLSLSYNMIQNIDSDVFTNQKYLRLLDVSYNPKLNLTLSLLNTTKTLDNLDLSGIKTGISFGNIIDLSLTRLVITNSSVTDVKKMQLNELRHMDDLNLSYNEITKLEVGSFSNISSLRFLDLSHNKIKDIQPGIFKDNTMIFSLNLAHNFLTTISYGIFHGLIYLSTLDISYNYINDLQNERFYEVNSLSVLIADHNKIELITEKEFVGTSLTKLSIGGNPIPCHVLVNLKRNNVPFEITAGNLYENNDENVNGVTCNRNRHVFDQITNVSSPYTAENAKILLSIRDIMLDHFKNEQSSKTTTNLDEKYLENITDQIRTSNADFSKIMSNFVNSTAHVMAENNDTKILLNKIHTTVANNETNALLNKILRALTLNSATRTPPVQVYKENATYEHLISYINKVKQELEDTLQLDKESIRNEMESKIEAKISAINLNTNRNILLTTDSPRHEKLSVSEDSKSLFTETCVVLILIILVGFVLFKVYKSGVFVRQRLSVSTRELPGSMDSAL